MDRARGLQAISTVAALGRAGVSVALAHVQAGDGDPFDHYGVTRPEAVSLVPIPRNLPWPFSRIHSNRIFFANLRRYFGSRLPATPVMVRHLKLAAMLADHVPGVRFLYEAHEVFGDTATGTKRDIHRRLEEKVMQQATALVANSAATANRLKQLYPQCRRIEVVPNGVEIPPELPEKQWQAAGQHVVYAGSFFPWKGAADLIRAAGFLPGYKVTMIGGNALRISELRRIVEPKGADVVFAGHLPHAQVMSMLAGSCIAVLPNRDDTDSAFTSPIKLFEYMAAGCAIIASDLPAIREIIDELDALWFRPGDAESLAVAIRTLANDPKLAKKLGAAARVKVKRYSWDVRAQQLMALLSMQDGLTP